MNEVRINLNEFVKVKLTNLGKDIYYHQFDELNQQWGKIVCEPSFPKEDAEGYTKFQLWNFIEIYGEHFGMTKPNVIEPLDIIYELELEDTSMTDSVFDRLVKVLDTNCGYVDEEPAEKVANRIMRAGLLREEKPQKWEFLFNALDGTPRYICPVCKEIECRKTNFCSNCGANMQELPKEE